MLSGPISRVFLYFSLATQYHVNLLILAIEQPSDPDSLHPCFISLYTIPCDRSTKPTEIFRLTTRGTCSGFPYASELKRFLCLYGINRTEIYNF